MDPIEEVSENVYNLHIRVKPCSKKQEIVKTWEKEEWIAIKICSEAYHNKANKSLYEMKYDERVGLFVRCEDFTLEDYHKLTTSKKSGGFS